MLSLDNGRRYYFCQSPITFRYRHRGMRGFISSKLGRDPMNGDVYIFLSKDGRRMRVYYYHRRGEVMTEKVMHADRFAKPVFDAEKDAYCISWDSFVYLLEGILPVGRRVHFDEEAAEPAMHRDVLK